MFQVPKTPEPPVQMALRKRQRTGGGAVKEDGAWMFGWSVQGWKRGWGGSQGPEPLTAGLPQVLCATRQWAYNTTGKTDGEEVIGRMMGSVNEKHWVLWEPLPGWEVANQAWVGGGGRKSRNVFSEEVLLSFHPEFPRYPRQNLYTRTRMCNNCNFIMQSLMC